MRARVRLSLSYGPAPLITFPLCASEGKVKMIGTRCARACACIYIYTCEDGFFFYLVRCYGERNAMRGDAERVMILFSLGAMSAWLSGIEETRRC